jgi:hypothetical protein
VPSAMRWLATQLPAAARPRWRTQGEPSVKATSAILALSAPGWCVLVALGLEMLAPALLDALGVKMGPPVAALVSPPATIAAWIVWLRSRERRSEAQVALAGVACVAAVIGGLLAWSRMGLLTARW